VLLGSRAVLIESFEDGELVSKYTIQRMLNLDSQDAPPLSRLLSHFVVSRGEDVYLKMLLVDNLMHADLHPGNILLQEGASRASQPKLVLLDVGMVARLTRAESDAFVGLLHAMGTGDGRAAARAVLRFSAEQSCQDPAAFAAGMVSLFRERCRGFGTGVKFGEVLRGVLGLVRQHRVAIDANYMTLVTNVLVLEGMAGVLDPSYNVLDAARPLLFAHRTMPGPLFRALLPLVSAAKNLQDRLRLLAGE